MSDLDEDRLYREALTAPTYNNLNRAREATIEAARRFNSDRLEKLLEYVDRLIELEGMILGEGCKAKPQILR